MIFYKINLLKIEVGERVFYKLYRYERLIILQFILTATKHVETPAYDKSRNLSNAGDSVNFYGIVGTL